MATGNTGPLAQDIIARLKLDTTDLANGYSQAKSIQASAQAEMLALDAQRQQIRARLEQDYTAQARAATMQRIGDLQTELAATLVAMNGKTAAEQTALAASAAATRQQLQDQVAEIQNYNQLTQQLSNLNVQYREQTATMKEAQAASTALRSQGIDTGQIQTLMGLLGNLGPGFAAIQSSLSGILGAIAILGGGTGFTGMAAGEAGAAEGFSLLGLSGTALIGTLAAVAAGTVAVGAALLGAGDNVTQWAHTLTLTSDEMGMSTDQMQKLQFAMSAMGVPADNITTAVRMLSKAITDGNPMLAQMGVATRDSAGQFRDTFSVIMDFSAALQKLPSDAEKINAISTVFGRWATSMIPFFEGDPGKIAALFAQVDESGIKNVASLNAVAEASDLASARVTMGWRGVEAQLGTTAVNIKTALLNALADYLDGLDKVMEKGVFPAAPGAPMPPAPGAPMPPVPPSSLFAPPPAPEDPAVIAAREKLAEAQGRGASLTQQIADAQQKLNALKTIGAKLDADEAAGIVNKKALVDNYDAQAAAIGKLNELNTKRKTDLAEISKIEDEIARKLSETPPAANLQPQTQQDRLMGIEMIQIPRLQQQRASIPTTPDNKEAILAVDKQINDLLTERDKILTSIVDKRTKTAKASADELAAQKQQNIDEANAINVTVGPTPFPASPLAGLTAPAGPSAAVAALGTAMQEAQTTAASLEGKAITPEKAVEQYQQQAAALKDMLSTQYNVLSTETAGSTEWTKQLALIQEIKKQLDEVNKATADTSKQTDFGTFLSGLGDFAKVLGKFSGGLGQQASIVGASIQATLDTMKNSDATDTIFKDLFSGNINMSTLMSAGMKITEGVGIGVSAASGKQGIAGIFTGAFGMANMGEELGKGISSSMGDAVGSAGSKMAGSLGGILGGALGGLMGIFGAMKNKKAQQSAALVTAIQENVKAIGNNLTTGAANLTQTISALQAQQAQAVAQTQSGKGGNTTQMQQTIDSINQSLAQLQAQQQQILDNFRAQIAMFAEGSVGLQTYAQGIQQIAQALTAAAGAGASAAEQTQYLNAAMTNLTNQLGTSLAQAEQNTIGLMLQSLDLQQQRADLVANEAEQEQSILSSLGLAPKLTPAQQAAEQIAQLRNNLAEQLQSIDAQQANLQAQIGGEQQLFNLTSDRNALLQEQLAIQQQITAQNVANIQAQMEFYAQLLEGVIPNLPANLLPPGSTIGSGTTFQMGSVTIQIVLPDGSTLTPDTAAALVKQGLQQIATQQQAGYQAS